MSDWETIGADGGWETLPEKPPKSTLEKLSGMVPSPGRFLADSAFGQTAAGLTSGMLAAPIAGIAGLGRTMLSGPEEGAATVRRVQDALTYQPQSKSAQTALQVLGYPGEKIAEYGEFAGEHGAERTGSPLLGAGLNTAAQAVPMLFGARLPGARASAFERTFPGGELPGTTTKRNAAQVAALQGDTAAVAARDAGYALPPTQVNKSFINQAVEGAAGKIKTAQDLSERNQPISNRLIRETFDLPADVPLSTEALAAVRKQAGQAYEQARGAGQINATPAYSAALDAIEAPYKNAAKSFPDAPPSPVVDAVNTVRRDSFDAGAAVDQIRIMRDKADAAYRGGDKGLGGAYKGIANALEEAIDQHLTAAGAPSEVVSNLRAAREQIAQTYTVQKHLQPSGNIDAQGLARELARKPLTGNIRTVAEFGSNFKKAAQVPEKIGGVPMSPLDYAVSLGSLGGAVISGNPMLALGAATPFARPALRKGLMSDAYQRALVNPPSRGPSLGSRVVQGAQQPGAIPGLQSLGLDARRQELLRQLLEQEGAVQ